jgi:hypothetical protein
VQIAAQPALEEDKLKGGSLIEKNIKTFTIVSSFLIEFDADAHRAECCK